MLAGRYRLNQRIGAGGMGAVYEGVHVDLNRRVAIKVLLDPHKRATARFEQEALANAKVNSPHVVNVIDFIVDESGKEPPFLVMELLEGESLARRLRRDLIVPIEEALDITRQVLAGLEAAHQLGIVHRDIKPTNIWLSKPASPGDAPLVKILDFGVAKLLVDPRAYKTTTGTLVGTPSYLAPEQINGTPIDGRTDLHAVAIVLFEMITGQRPWGDRRGPEVVLAILTEKPPTLLERLPTIPPALSSVVERTLSKHIEERPRSAAAMSAELLASLPTATPPLSRSTARRSRSRSSRTFLVALTTTILLACVIGIPVVAKRRSLTDPRPSPLPSASSTPIVKSRSESPVEDASNTTNASSASSTGSGSNSDGGKSLTAPATQVASKPTELPPGARPFCRCEWSTSGFVFDLCDQPMPSRCTCETKDPPEQLCTKRFVVSTSADGQKSWRCELWDATGPDVKAGARCVGFGRPSATPDEHGRPNIAHDEVLIRGTYGNCTNCYNPPLRPAIPNTSCAGFTKEGRHEGVWRCYEGGRIVSP